MALLNAHNLTQAFGHYDVFSGITAKIEPKQKIGLVGPNGVGKTTLLRILAGVDQPTAGSVYQGRGMRLGYLRQEAVQAFAGRENTLYAEMLTVYAAIQSMEARLREMEAQMATGDVSDALLEAYSTLQEAFEIGGGYEYEVRIEQVLDGLGFHRDDFEMRLDHLSGGQKTRALLARLLLEAPDLLILDEPTNHLDVEAIEWLERTLTQWQGALVIVSHDRYFLDRVVNAVWEMFTTHIETYRGNYSAYSRQRVERWARRQKEFDANKQRLGKEFAFVQKHIASGRGHGMAMGKLRRLSTELETAGKTRSIARVKDKIKSLERPSGEWDQMSITLKGEQRSGNIVLRTQNLIAGYDEPLFTTDDITLYRGECAALIGPNGAGKTTFLRTVLDQLPPIGGSVELGVNLEIGYFAQAHDNLDPKRKVIDEIRSRKAMDVAEARNYLAQYLFQGDDVFKPVRALSGGERGRLALAILALKGANLLLLDEPTNHLDIPAQEVLQTVLETFNGTILMVSHDRYLVSRLASQIWDLREGHLGVHQGDYQSYVVKRDG